GPAEGAGGPGPGSRTAPRTRGLRERGDRRGVHGGAREPRGAGRGPGPGSILRPRGAGTGPPGQAAVLGGWGSEAAAFPFSCPRPCSAASSSSLGPRRRRRRRLSLGALRASSLHQGRADPQGPSREVRGCCRFPQLLVAIFNPPPPPAFSTSRWLPD
ncbi:uncharacterized protein LOC108590749, partial [Callithrix jacchus]|uniref:uncharacterized protein LOC108590749 n=1 Tax=Callithrix jacchus TaxID=9483 RepID=UPI00083FF0C9